MKAAVYDENGPPGVLREEVLPDPVPGPRDVLLRVQAISIEGGDILHRRGVPPPSARHVVGYQAAGVVEAVGPQVRSVRPGQRVAGFNWSGSHAELFVVPEHFAYPVPEGLDIQVAAAVPVTFGTADDALFEVGRLRADETVLVRGGAGGVGLAAIQLAAAAGARVIATASGAQRVAALRDYGASHGIDHAGADVVQSALEITGGRGVDLLLDLAGGKDAATMLRALRFRGRCVLVGAASGRLPAYGFMDLVPNGLSVCAVAFGREMHLPRVHQMLARHLRAAADGLLRMPVAAVFPLAQAAAAHAHVEQGHPFGRVLLAP